MTSQRILTGITPSGTPHLGNYAGAIRPAVEASQRPGVESFYFLSDYHALIKTDNPERVQRSTLEIAATWLAAGLRPERVWFYRQSDIPEIPELAWLLACVTGKGLLNRAHAYKAILDKNEASGEEPDAGVSMGLFMYPVLMAADILMFNAHKVPVGRDQVQHLEMARDIAASFNHRYGGDHFVLPEAAVDESVATLPGLDGRKMSKSYDNTIPLFAPAATLKKLVLGIVTDSKAPGEPKETEGCALFQIFQAFATPEETEAMRTRFAGGIAWGEAKEALFSKLESVIAPMRARYEELIDEPARIEQVLKSGAAALRAKYATPFIARLRKAVGLRPLDHIPIVPPGERIKAKTTQPQFKQYRESDGLFYFKLISSDGRTLMQSRGFTSPLDVGQTIADIKKGKDYKPWVERASIISDADIRQAIDAMNN